MIVLTQAKDNNSGITFLYIIVYTDDLSLSKASSAVPRDLREWKVIKVSYGIIYYKKNLKISINIT